MNIYKTKQIRNVVLLGHGGCGKTSLVEAMAHLSGLTNRIGNIRDGNTLSDFDKEEVKREFSIHTSLVPLPWKDYKINIMDTPGYFDFIGEVEEAASAADAAIIVVSGKEGVEVGTQKAWELCEKYKLPRMFFVANMDDDNASFRQVVDDLTDMYGKRIAPFFMPIRENEKLVGYVNIVKKGGRKFKGLVEKDDCEIPNHLLSYFENYREKLLDAVAETSDEYMERYFNGETFSDDEIREALRNNVIDGTIIPVTMGSNSEIHGVYNLLNDIVKYFPSPDKLEKIGTNTKTDELFEANYDENNALTAYVFKTIADPFIGKYSLIKVCSGILKSDSVIYNAEKDIEEKLSKLYLLQGKTSIEVKELYAGDIGAIAKLSKAKTGDTLSIKNDPVIFEKVKLPVPYTYMRYSAKNKGEDDKVSQALAKIMDEDQTVKVVNDTQNRQALLYGMGEQHLEVIISKILSKYKVEIDLSKPKVAFKETICKSTQVQGKYKKQSGGHGQYGDVKMIFEPLGDLEKPYLFEEKIFGGSVPRNFFPAIEKGIQESLIKGPLAAYPVVGVKATLIDGSYHPVDSSELAFKTAAMMAFKKGFMEASPILLEPIVALKVNVPEQYTGDIMGDLNKRRGRVNGMIPVEGGRQIIEADIPMTELFGYSTQLRSMTGGRGDYSYQFQRYEQAPAEVAQREIEARASKVTTIEE
ncbi:MAG: elongation factor G [Lachnotalea sp.]